MEKELVGYAIKKSVGKLSEWLGMENEITITRDATYWDCESIPIWDKVVAEEIILNLPTRVELVKVFIEKCEDEIQK